MTTKKTTKTSKTPTAKDSSKTEASVTAWNFPKHPLEEAIAIPRAIEEKHAGNPVDAEDLAKMVGFKRSDDWRFRDLLRAASLYGLVDGSGAKATVALTDIGNDIVAPDSPSQRQKALLLAFQAVQPFKDVSDFYHGKKIPEDEYFQNTLTKKFEIPRDRVQIFSKTFIANLTYLKSFAAEQDEESNPEISEKTSPSTEEPRNEKKEVREFLDTCFILMPFGNYFDAYYKSIYIPATKEAGFEPVRADDLFSTGSVMEQIWEQIRKAKVLLADLTGKNPNVFYELGLAHALAKPVVLLSGNLADVPFDLRHLRVIVYDVNLPGWDDYLKQNITTYLKNTREDPEKSIPQPYRELESPE